MNEKREKMIEKVKKLLSLANNNPNENEAISSALKAQEIMAKFDIEEYELDDVVECEKIVDKETYVGAGKKWKGRLASIIARNFRCKIYYSAKKTSIFFHGHESDTEIASQVFTYLFENGNRLANDYVKLLRKRDCVTKGVYNSYVLGFTQGIDEKLGKQCTALMITVPQDVEESYNNLDLRNVRYNLTTSRYNKSAYETGITDAKNLVNSNTLEDNRKNITVK